MHRLVLALSAMVAWPLSAQFTDLTAPGHGDDLYYALQVPQPVADAWTRSPSANPIYKVGSVPPTLFTSFPAPVFPPNGIYLTGEPWYVSPYYLVSHPQFSRDGTVYCFTGKRVCLGGQGCFNVTATQTTVQGIRSGRDLLTFEGKGWLSGNGRYLLLQPEASPARSPQPSWVDLQTGQVQIVPGIIGSSPSFRDSNGRVVADDGTAVINACCIFRGGQAIPLPQSGSEPVIDAAARTVVYTATATGQRYLRVYTIATNQDRLLAHPNGDTYSPAISSDGRRVMFLSTAQWGTSDPPGTTQLYAINLDGTGFQELTSGSEPTGVQQYAMSDDGLVAWYVSGDDTLVKLDLTTGQTVRRVFRPAAVDLSPALVPGSAVTMSGAGIAGPRVTVNGLPAPIISAAPESVTFQVPWETQPGQPATLQVATDTAATVQATVTPAATRPSLIPVQGCAAAGLCDLGGGAIHQDWSGYVTQDRPALPGEVLHFYGTGFGSVQPAPATGTPASTNPLAVVPAMPVCTSDPGGPATVVYLGLAPGLVGYYQMEVQLPPAFSANHPTENRTYDQFFINCGPGAVAVFAIKTKAP
jgi:uncharacterized protein (TIGR03437 family)